MNGISFPGLGIDEFWIDPVAFTVFGKDVMWYGILITLGIICAYLTARVRARYEHIDEDTFFDIAMVTVLMGIVGARLYYVVFYGGFIEHGGTFWQNLWGSIKNIVAIWNGGLAIYGAVIAGALTILVFGLVRHVNIPKFMDAVAPSVILAQAIGRWGNFMNGEAHGGETDIFCRMGLRYSENAVIHYYHPTFLYESLWNLLGFILLYSFYKKKKFNGEIVLGYFTWYGLGRVFIEGLRTDSLYLGNTGIRVSQLIAGVCFVVGLVLIAVGRRVADRIPALRLDAPSGCEERFAAEESRRSAKKSADSDAQKGGKAAPSPEKDGGEDSKDVQNQNDKNKKEDEHDTDRR